MSVYLAICFNEDLKYSKQFYSKICGVELKNFILMEYEFIKLINYNLYFDTDYYKIYYNLIKDLLIVSNK
jgi:hypothetical protein